MKAHTAAEWWNKNVHAFCPDERNVLREDSQIASADGCLINGNQGSSGGVAMAKYETVDDAAGGGEVRSVKTTDRDVAVAGLLQILQHRTLLEGPETGVKYDGGSYQ